MFTISKKKTKTKKTQLRNDSHPSPSPRFEIYRLLNEVSCFICIYIEDAGVTTTIKTGDAE